MTSESAFSLCTGYGSVKADQVPRLLYIVAIRLLLAGYQHLHALVFIQVQFFSVCQLKNKQIDNYTNTHTHKYKVLDQANLTCAIL